MAAEVAAETSKVVRLEGLNFDNTFVRELPADPETANRTRQVNAAAYTRVNPNVSVPEGKLVDVSEDVAKLVGLDTAVLGSKEFVEAFSGAAVPEGAEPYAQNYGGHQFGHWAGQLGDGRAITLGEVVNKQGERWELQLKGGGKTPYSRMADGRAVLRSSIREFLCSEAMHWLGVPTTRALSVITTGEGVMRDMFYRGDPKVEPGAVVCRTAPSFVRFGTFQLPASRGGEKNDLLIKQLADYVIKYHYSEFEKEGDGKYLRMLQEVIDRTATLAAWWQTVGFCHGVLNTDNMSILGLTIDYGPFAFLDDMDPSYTPNLTDLEGKRYCFMNQPDICLWNVAQLANALLRGGLLEKEAAQEAINKFPVMIAQRYGRKMRAKLGLKEGSSADVANKLMEIMVEDSADFTNTFRSMSGVKWQGVDEMTAGDEELLAPLARVLEKVKDVKRREAWAEWVRIYIAELREQGVPDDERKAAMDAVNPKYVLRNYLLQIAIEKAEQGDLSEVRALHKLIQKPYEDQEGMDKYTDSPPEWAARPGVCMLSCSS